MIVDQPAKLAMTRESDAQQKAGLYPDALDSAQRAVRTASTDEQEHMSEALRDALLAQVSGRSR